MPTSPRKPDPPRTRAAGLWVSFVLFAVVLLLLLIFTLQNSQHARVSFFGWHASLPLGVALLLAAVFGVLLVALPGTARIVQLRVLSRRRNRAGHVVTEPTPLPNDAPSEDPIVEPAAGPPEPRTRDTAASSGNAGSQSTNGSPIP